MVGLGEAFEKRHLSRELKWETENSLLCLVWQYCQVGWWVVVTWKHGEKWHLVCQLTSFLLSFPPTSLLLLLPSFLPFSFSYFLISFLSFLRFNPGITRGFFKCIAVCDFELYSEGNRGASKKLSNWDIAWSDLNFTFLEIESEIKKLGIRCSEPGRDAGGLKREAGRADYRRWGW